VKRPSIKTPCVADRYHNERQRIAEVFGPLSQAGCLISASEHQDDEGRWFLDVSIYRADGDVHARVKIQGVGK
jgi:hypothetical protein